MMDDLCFFLGPKRNDREEPTSKNQEALSMFWFTRAAKQPAVFRFNAGSTWAGLDSLAKTKGAGTQNALQERVGSSFLPLSSLSLATFLHR